MLPHLAAPAFGGSDLEPKWCDCSHSLLCLTSWSLFTPHPSGPQRAAPLRVTGSATPAIWSSTFVVPSLNEFEEKQGAAAEERRFLSLPYDPDSF